MVGLVHIPSTSSERHPFSIALWNNNRDSVQLQFHIKATGRFTQKLWDLEDGQVQAYFEGPFATNISRALAPDASNILFVGAGAGSPAVLGQMQTAVTSHDGTKHFGALFKVRGGAYCQLLHDLYFPS